MKKTITENDSLKFYVALQGNKTPEEYIRLGKLIENLGFDRIYVYSDLMFKPAWPILTLIAQHTSKIELGPCLVNGFYTHPALIAANIAFLDELSDERAVLGVGRGAFFDFLNMDDSEAGTRQGCEDTILLVKRFLAQRNDYFRGKHFEANDKAMLRWPLLRSDIPLVVGSWNEKMARLAGKHCDELQIANVWTDSYLQELQTGLLESAAINMRDTRPNFSIGGMCCIAPDERQAISKAKTTIAIYLPYIKTILKRNGIDIHSKEIKQIDYYSKRGYFGIAASYVSDEIVQTLSLTGHPQKIVTKLEETTQRFDVSGVMFSPPYGVSESIEENLQFIQEQVISKMKCNAAHDINPPKNLNEKIDLLPKERKPMDNSMTKYDAIIIGGGLAGLTCAISLLRKGKSVRLLEKMHMTGGCQGYYKRGGFLFEPNIHSVAEAGENGLVTHTLASLGLSGKVQFERVDPNAYLIFPDDTFSIPAELGEYLSKLRQKFPAEASNIDKLFKTMGEIFQGVAIHQGKAPIVGEYAGKVFQELLDEFIEDKKLQAIIAGFWGWGFPPATVSALVFSTLTYSLCANGNYLPRGGINKIVELLEKEVRERGGNISLKSPVKEILIQNGKAGGVVLESGERLKGRAIISNADVNTTFFDMIGEQHFEPYFLSKIKKLEPALSCFNVVLGIKDSAIIPKEFSSNNFVYPNYDFNSQYAAMLSGELEKAPFCISIPTLISPELAPEGHHILTLYMPMAYRPKSVKNWKASKTEYTERFIDQAEKYIPGLREQIVITEASTPETLIRYTGNSQGAIAGWNYTPYTDISRPKNETPIQDLYLTGHWTFPGPGTHSAIPSGCITAALIP